MRDKQTMRRPLPLMRKNSTGRPALARNWINDCYWFGDIFFAFKVIRSLHMSQDDDASVSCLRRAGESDQGTILYDSLAFYGGIRNLVFPFDSQHTGIDVFLHCSIYCVVIPEFVHQIRSTAFRDSFIPPHIALHSPEFAFHGRSPVFAA
jgi:hypothetical protein